jgi:hypothetical protein
MTNEGLEKQIEELKAEVAHLRLSVDAILEWHALWRFHDGNSNKDQIKAADLLDELHKRT